MTLGEVMALVDGVEGSVSDKEYVPLRFGVVTGVAGRVAVSETMAEPSEEEAQSLLPL